MEIEIFQEFMPRISAFLARTLGLQFSAERWPELRRSVAAAASVLGFEGDADGCLRWLADAPLLSNKQLESLAAHLTVGETYFFRERRHFEFLTTQILPELIGRSDRRLRIWSAGCCSGEEAYSIAIMLRRALPDLEQWDVTLLATDINPEFLRKAEAGVYGPWSFRDVPDWFKGPHFRALPNGHFEVRPEIKRMVQFSPLNLAADSYPSLLNDTHAMDIIFCRNVLMYFTPSQARHVIEKMYRTQREGGWLFVSSSELVVLTSSHYATVKAPDMVVFRKGPRQPIQSHPVIEQVRSEEPNAAFFTSQAEVKRATTEVAEPYADAAALYAEGRYQEAADSLIAWLSTIPPECAGVPTLNLLTQCLANQGQLAEALRCCDRSIAADKCNAASRYLRALILQEQGSFDEASISLRHALFLDPDFVLAYVALGTLARKRGEDQAASKHLKHAMTALKSLPPDTILSKLEGMTSSQLANTIQSLMHEGAVP